MSDARTNFAYSTVAIAPSPATTGTSLTVAASTASEFPTPPFNLVVAPVGAAPLGSNSEIVRVISRSSDTFTIVRQQENTSARAITAGDQVFAGITARVMQDVDLGWYNVMSYGAVGNNTNDDTAAFQAATNDAAKNAATTGGGGVIYAPRPPVAYVVSNVTYPVGGLTFRGAGYHSSWIYQKAGASGYMFASSVPNSALLYGLTFEDLALEGYNNQAAGTGGIDLTSCVKARINRTQIGYFEASMIRIMCGPSAGAGTYDSIKHSITNSAFVVMLSGNPMISFVTNPAAGDNYASSGQGYTTIHANNFDGNGSAGSTAIGGVHTGSTITGNTIQAIQIPYSCLAQNSRFKDNTCEVLTGTMEIIVIATGPGFGGANGFGSSTNIFESNSYATHGDPASFSFIDNGYNTQRIFDGGSPGVPAVTSPAI